MIRRPPRSTPFPTRRSSDLDHRSLLVLFTQLSLILAANLTAFALRFDGEIPGEYAEMMWRHAPAVLRSEEHTSELQSRQYLVCRLLLEKKKYTTHLSIYYSC